jgi:hypothetical protein
MKITALNRENRTRKISNANIPQPPERKFLDLPTTREGWSRGEWAGFYTALRARESK